MRWLLTMLFCGALALSAGACSTKPTGKGSVGSSSGGYVGVGGGIGF